MKKTDLLSKIADQSGLSKANADKALTALSEIVTEALKTGDKVTLPGLGTFSVKERAARTGRNPHTGETIAIPATNVPAFKISKTLKDNLK